MTTKQIDEQSHHWQTQANELLCRQVRQRLDGDRVSASVQSRLRHARHQALEQAQIHPIDRLSFWRPLASFASALALVATVFYLGQLEPDNSTAIAEEDVAVLFSEDDLELYENLEFYAWLATAEGQ